MGRRGINRSAIKLSDFFGSEFIDWVCKDGDFLAVEKIPGGIKVGAKESILWGETKRQMHNALSGFNVRVSNGESPILVATDPEQAEVDGVVSERLGYLLNSLCHRLNNCQLGGSYPPIYSLGSLLIFLGANNVVPRDAEGIKNTTLGTVVLNIAKLFSINIKDALRLEPGRIMTFYPDPEEPLVLRLGNRNSKILLKTLVPSLPRDYARHWAVGLIEMVLGIIPLVYPKIENAFAVCGGDNSNLSYQRLKLYGGPDSEGKDQGLYISTCEHEKGISVVLKARESASVVALFDKKLHRFDFFPKLPNLKSTESHIGFELEMEFDNSYGAADNAVEMYKIASEHNITLLMKSDGSLSEDGVEIVSLPMPSNAIPLVGIGKFLRDIENNLDACPDSGCGLHFHISSAPYRLAIARALELDETSSTETHIASSHYILAMWLLLGGLIRPLAGRENNAYCKRVDRYNIAETYNKSRGLFNDRYTEINVSESNTFELRLFSATLNISEFTSRLLLTREFDRCARATLDAIQADVSSIYDNRPSLNPALGLVLYYLATIEKRIGIERLLEGFYSRVVKTIPTARRAEQDEEIALRSQKVGVFYEIKKALEMAEYSPQLDVLIEALGRMDMSAEIAIAPLVAEPERVIVDDDYDEDFDDFDADDSDDEYDEGGEVDVALAPQEIRDNLTWVSGFVTVLPRARAHSRWEMSGVDRTGEPEWTLLDLAPNQSEQSAPIVINNTEVEL
jgi:hypothetical protein